MLPAALVLVLLSGAGAAAPTRNILYMIADDMRPEWDAYCPSCGLHTPHLNQLVQEGLLFTRAYCQQAICGPSRNSFISGRRCATSPGGARPNFCPPGPGAPAPPLPPPLRVTLARRCWAVPG